MRFILGQENDDNDRLRNSQSNLLIELVPLITGLSNISSVERQGNQEHKRHKIGGLRLWTLFPES